MPYLIGTLTGGVLGVYIMYCLWEWALFKRVANDPMIGKLASVVAAYLSASTIYGLLKASGGPFVASGFVVYLPGAVIIGVIAYRSAQRVRRQIAEQTGDIF